MQVVKTDKGYISGTVIGEPGKEVSIFRGIPYAAPPVGELRWKPPQPAAPWTGIRECTQFSAVSPQIVILGTPPDFPMSEDCLYLNVLTPARKPGEKLPVMVWMHGGGYTAGCGNDTIWNNYRLPSYGVVLVTITHRLGPIGLAAHPALSKESPHGASGNYTFLDLVAALQWVQRNIAAFGGDPGNITIFGESGGGGKVSIMMASPLAKGLFHRAICESGNALDIFPGRPLAELENTGLKLFEKLGVNTPEEARKVPWDKILKASQALEGPPIPGFGLPRPTWDTTVDGWMLPQSPSQAFASGSYNAVPLIVSANLGELTGPGPLVMPIIINTYVDMLNAENKAKVNGYACIFDQVPANWRKEGCVCPHSMELPYVFGDWDDSTGWWKSVSMLAQQSGAKTAQPALDAADRYVSESMMRLWTQFAKTGKPSVKGLVDWPPYTRASDQYLYINKTLEVKTGFSTVAQKK